MTPENIAASIEASLLTPGTEAITRAYGGDRMSDLLSEVTHGTLLVTNLSHALLAGPVALMDGAGICLLNGIKPEPALVEAVADHGMALMVSPHDMSETCARLGHLFGDGLMDTPAQ